MRAPLVMPADEDLEEQGSLADLFLQASRSLAQSDARLYRSVDRHLSRTRELLMQAEAEAKPNALALNRGEATTPLVFGTPSFERQSRKSLQTLCKLHGVHGYSRMSKATMILRLQEAGVAPPPVPMEVLSKGELLALLRDLLHTPTPNG